MRHGFAREKGIVRLRIIFIMNVGAVIGAFVMRQSDALAGALI